MSYRGPIPKPTVLKVLEGNPGRRPLNDREPQPRAKTPQCPDHLDDVGKKQWRRLVPILRTMRVLTEADYIALANLCQTYSLLLKVQTQLGKSGLLIKSGESFKQTPLLKMLYELLDRVNMLCREFGLTPASRGRLHLDMDQAEDDPDGILDF